MLFLRLEVSTELDGEKPPKVRSTILYSIVGGVVGVGVGTTTTGAGMTVKAVVATDPPAFAVNTAVPVRPVAVVMTTFAVPAALVTTELACRKAGPEIDNEID
jgi:hypothetical protein